MELPQVRWWHRLIFVLLGLTLLPVAAFALVIAYESSDKLVYRYSWRGDEMPAGSTRCRATMFESISELDIMCGEYEMPDAVLSDMVAHGAIKASSIPLPRTVVNDAYTLNAVSEASDFRFAYDTELVPRLAWKNFGIAVAVIVGWAFLCGLAFSVILWIVHGTTRFR